MSSELSRLDHGKHWPDYQVIPDSPHPAESSREHKTARAASYELLAVPFPSLILHPLLTMNAEATLQPAADLARRATHELQTRVQTLVQTEPGKAVAAAAGAWLVLHVIPARWIVRSVVGLVRPALLVLGMCKAYELCRTATTTAHERSPKRPRH